jgi:UDP-3-O-[3-hydroxymyristoyl] glucosamine N-acyltransferase
VLSKADAEKLAAEIDALRRGTSARASRLRDELAHARKEELDKRWPEIYGVVVEYAREKGYDLVVEAPVLYASPSVDITDAVLERLRAAGRRRAAAMSAPRDYTLAELAERFGSSRGAAAATRIAGVATLASAGAGPARLPREPALPRQLKATRARRVVLAREELEHAPGPALVAGTLRAFARIAALFEQRPRRPPGDPSDARGRGDAEVDPARTSAAMRGRRARAHRARRRARARAAWSGTTAWSGRSAPGRARHAGRARAPGRARADPPGRGAGRGRLRLAQDQGRGSRCRSSAAWWSATTARSAPTPASTAGALGDTVLHEDVRLDNLDPDRPQRRDRRPHRDRRLRRRLGSTKIGRYCLIGGQAGFVGHIEICDRVTIGGGSRVTHSIREPGEYTSGTALMPHKLWRKNAARFNRLDATLRKIIKEDRD